ncbi:MAG TPA: glutathione S-transferase [Myxococcota bacterium]|nr:glutathione S-transferase [Myxococcota bacterium]
MIEVHHLNTSRSLRILWLLEELELPYEVVKHQRDPQTFLAPDSLKAVHPLGKSPVIRDGGQLVIESGAILEYIVRKYGKGRLAPPESSPDFVRYLQWMHYAEGSAMLPLMLELYLRRLGDAGAPLRPRVHGEIENHIGYLNAELGASDYFVGDSLTAADIQLAFVVQMARIFYGLEKFSNLARFVERMEARPAYRRALERGGA